jgi:hypothetical protein
MRRFLYLATFSLILLSLPLWAQRHGGGGGAHFASGQSFAGHSSGSFHGGSSAGSSLGYSRAGSYGRGSGVHVRTGSIYGRRGFYGRRGYYPYYPYAYYPYLGDYGFYSDSYGDQDSYANENYANADYPPPYREDSGVQRDVQDLSSKIDRLQADVEARNRMKPEQEPETALVFRDKHVEEVRNYAISGGTLWVFTQNVAKKIPLTQLDLDATAKMNDGRGVDFQVPEPALSIEIVR